MCREHIINFVDLIDFFIKSRVILIKEKIWNYYKNIEDNEPQKIVLLQDILKYIENDLNAVINFPKFFLFCFLILFFYLLFQNQQLKLTNIAREKAIALETPLSFNNFDMLFKEYETSVLMENRRASQRFYVS